MKTIKLATVLGVLVVGVVAWSRFAKHSSEPRSRIASGDAPLEANATQPPPVLDIPAEAAPDRPVLSNPVEPPVVVSSTPTVQFTEPKRATGERKDSAGPKQKNSASASNNGGTPKGKPAPQDPTAREALYFVGADPIAEEYWLDAINDPSLPGQERQDLIEDLNEDGLTDPHHPTIDDLPLIVSRIELIEEVGQDAMDQVNFDAFQEAYKDLLNLAKAASGDAAP